MKTLKIAQHQKLFILIFALFFVQNLFSQTEKNKNEHEILVYVSDDKKDADAQPGILTKFEIGLDEFILLEGEPDSIIEPYFTVTIYKTDEIGKPIWETRKYSSCKIEYSNLRTMDEVTFSGWLLDCKLIPNPEKNLLPASFPLTFTLGIPYLEYDSATLFNKEMKPIREFPRGI